ncbi:NAD(P)H-dependent flavin oxidoreductase [Aurantiacibacter poecillastricola]|uniref:NAD(P)H-dependent flavin oxidoreductase n=1 Tax=Aurantiacibacter poecillastricola TaxID=3064385 RepID=UPI00273E3116|nr:nitronate monooxygenase [Aurantiacibacter sp. 219JJ12-13]MDP5261714.1 nitronate monooxygenase [Aurantiacibacter sp. 219JJ12-13]
MFLVSGPDLVVESCKAGLCGTFPALNQRTTEGFDEWLTEIKERLGEDDAPYGVNLIVHGSNPRVQADLEVCIKHEVPLIITSLGAVPELVDAVHSYGGLVFHDVIKKRHAEKAAEAGVDGIIAVAAGAGGHAGTYSPFALTSEIREFWDGALILSGSMSHGGHIAAAQMMGCDFAYFGSHFIAATESMASQEQKDMMIGAGAGDITYTDRVTGVGANFLTPSLDAATLHDAPGEMSLNEEAKAWKTIWSAGHGTGATREVRPAKEICEQLIAEYEAARAKFCG